MKTLTIQERLESFWAGERPDRIPYTIYWNEWRHSSADPAWEALYDKGLGVTWHLESVAYKYSGVERSEQNYVEDGSPTRKITLGCPEGEIYETYVDGWRRKFFLETPQDYRVMIDLVRRTEAVPAYEEFLRRSKDMGRAGVPLVMLGRTPFQTILVDYAGLENFAFQLYEMEAEILELYEILLEQFRKTVELAAAGPGRFVSVLENFTAESLGPERYERFLLPVYEELFPVLQGAGKIVGTHYDGRLASCKDLVARAPMDLIESLTPPPEGDISLAEARAAWPDKLFWSNINVGAYELPPRELRELVLSRVSEAAPEGRGLAFEVSEQFPENWKESMAVVLDALEETKD